MIKTYTPKQAAEIIGEAEAIQAYEHRTEVGLQEIVNWALPPETNSILTDSQIVEITNKMNIKPEYLKRAIQKSEFKTADEKAEELKKLGLDLPGSYKENKYKILINSLLNEAFPRQEIRSYHRYGGVNVSEHESRSIFNNSMYSLHFEAIIIIEERIERGVFKKRKEVLKKKKSLPLMNLCYARNMEIKYQNHDALLAVKNKLEKLALELNQHPISIVDYNL